MNQMMKFENILTMSSREIAELTGKRHDNVMRDIREMMRQLDPYDTGDGLEFEDVYKDGKGEERKYFNLPKREVLILVSGYSVMVRAKIIDRWQKLEEEAEAPKHLIPQTLPEALRLAADLADQRDRAVASLMIAAPKVEAFDLLKNADGLICVRDAAKILQVSERKVFIPWLLSHRWMYRRPVSNKLVGHQDKCNIGYLEHKFTTTTRGDGSEKEVAQVLITPKGMSRLADIFSNRSQTELFAA